MAFPPGPRAPAIYSLLRWMMNPVASFQGMFREYGDIYSIVNPAFGMEVIVSGPEMIKAIFTGDPDVLHAGEANLALAPILGSSSVLLLDGPKHHRERRMLLPPFHGERLSIYGGVMREATARVAASLPRGERFSILPWMQRITLDVILKTVFGALEGEETDALGKVLVALLDQAQSPLGMLLLIPALQRDLGPLTPWASLQRSLRAADDFIYGMIAKARAGGGAGTSVLSLLLAAVDEDGQPMTDAELRDELVTLLVAGHETTATALSWAIDDIERRPDVRARILAEIEAAPPDAPGAPLPYLDATIKEVLRLRPIVPLVGRKLKAPMKLGGYDLPEGTLLVPCAFLAQRHPAYWDAPDELRPERFLDKDRKPDPYAFFPFGGGARRCIGMAFALYEMRVVLATLLSSVELRVPDKPAKVTLRSFLFAPSGGPRVSVGRELRPPRPAVPSPALRPPLPRPGIIAP
jgi:cytochrome P450